MMNSRQGYEHMLNLHYKEIQDIDTMGALGIYHHLAKRDMGKSVAETWDNKSEVCGVCPECGYPFLVSSFKFCPECATRLLWKASDGK